MKKIKYILVLVIFCLTFNVKAIDQCTSEEMNRLRNLANQVEFKQEIFFDNLDEEDNGMTDEIMVSYKISMINYNDELDYYIKTNNDELFEKLDINELNNLYFYPGETLSIRIYSYTENSCTNDLLTTKTIKFNYYNDYYYFHKDKCKEYPEFKYCKEFIQMDKEFEEIDKLFNEYIQKNDPSSTSNKFVDNNTIIYIISGVGLIILISVIIFIIKRKKQNDL